MKRKSGESGKNSPSLAQGLSRRRFGQLAMMGLAGSAILPRELLWPGRASELPAAAMQEEAGEGFPPQARAEIQEKLDRIFATYGSRLSAGQKQRMRGIVSYHVQMLETVRAIPLENPDAPATVLKLVTGKSGSGAKGRRAAVRRRTPRSRSGDR
jgi:hypothetical protein